MTTPEPAPGAVDTPAQGPSGAGGCSNESQQHTICTLVAEIDELHADNVKLRGELDLARSQRDSANAQLTHYRTHYTQTGW